MRHSHRQATERSGGLEHPDRVELAIVLGNVESVPDDEIGWNRKPGVPRPTVVRALPHEHQAAMAVRLGTAILQTMRRAGPA